jgi:hypothetical protein
MFLEHNAHHHQSVSTVFPCAGYMLLEPGHASFIQYHLQVYHIKGKRYKYATFINKGFKISKS